MELKVNEVQLPQPITFNYEELKAELTEKIKHYENIVYTDEQIKEAKADRSSLNKLKKALNDERIRREREYMVPFNDFKTKINEIIGIIDKPVGLIDRQIKEFEEKQKADKRAAIEELFANAGFPDFVTIDMIFDDKWLNASTSMKKIEDDMTERKTAIVHDVYTLSQLHDFGFEATEVYKKSLDLNKVITEAQRMSQIAKAKAEKEAEIARMKAEEEAGRQQSRKAAEQEAEKAGEAVFNNAPDVSAQIPKEPEKQWVSFRCLLSVDDAQALGQFFKSRNITFEQI